MGGRRISIQDPDKIVDDWTDRGAEARERRRQEYREQRRALAAQVPVQIQRERVPVRLSGPDDIIGLLPAGVPEYKPGMPYPGYVSVEETFPDWDWAMKPWGPPLDDPSVKAYVASQRRAMEEYCRSVGRASA